MEAFALPTALSRHLAKMVIVVSTRFPVPIDEKNGLTAQQTLGVIVMKEEYRGFRPGDRVQMTECKDPYAPISPGAKGTVAHIDDAGTLPCCGTTEEPSAHALRRTPSAKSHRSRRWSF